MANLRDQLLKAGLIDKKAKHLAEQEEKAKAKAAKADARVAEQLAAEKAERERRYAEEFEARRKADREREAKRQEQLLELERMRRVESTIDRNKVSTRDGRRRFYFPMPDRVKVGRLDLHERQAKLLEEGELAIVFHPTDSKHVQLMDSDGVNELRSVDEGALLFFAPLWKPRPEPGAVAVSPELVPAPSSAEAPPLPAESSSSDSEALPEPAAASESSSEASPESVEPVAELPAPEASSGSPEPGVIAPES